MVTHQLQVERRTVKVRRPETDVLPLCHATNHSRIVSYLNVAPRTSFCSTKDDDEASETSKKKKTHESKLEVRFFSFTTLYYLVSSSAARGSGVSRVHGAPECSDLRVPGKKIIKKFPLQWAKF